MKEQRDIGGGEMSKNGRLETKSGTKRAYGSNTRLEETRWGEWEIKGKEEERASLRGQCEIGGE